MPSRLKRYQQSGSYHFLTFSCYRRQPLFGAVASRQVFEQELERARGWYKFYVFGYVVMPEHVHLLVSEPEEGILAGALQILKQTVSRKLPHAAAGEPFWQARYYDFNVVSDRKWKEKLDYIHYNPVTRGLVNDPADWHWSSFRHWQTGEMGTVEIESQWTFRLREKAGIPCTFTHRTIKDATFQAGPTLSPKTGDEDGAPIRPSRQEISKSGNRSVRSENVAQSDVCF